MNAGSEVARWPSGEPAAVTDAQAGAIRTIAERWDLELPVTVHPEFLSDAVLVVLDGGMVLGIEPDGYTHT